MKRVGVVFYFLAFVPASAEQGFSGDFVFRWLDSPEGSHRNMLLMEDVTYVDSNDKRWSVPAGTEIDGASIPRHFWTFVGSPFVGQYRRASVIHDYYCVVDTETTSDTHDMFHDASIFDGVGKLRADTMRLAIGIGGTGCGKADSPSFTFNLLQQIAEPGKEKEFAEVMATFAAKGSLLETDMESGLTRALEDTIDIGAPLTYQAALQYSRSPNDQTLQGLQNSIETEKPSAEQLRQIETLVRAVSPRQKLDNTK